MLLHGYEASNSGLRSILIGAFATFKSYLISLVNHGPTIRLPLSPNVKCQIICEEERKGKERNSSTIETPSLPCSARVGETESLRLRDGSE